MNMPMSLNERIVHNTISNTCCSSLSPSLLLLDGDKDNSSVMGNYQIKQGDIVYARLQADIQGLLAKTTTCQVQSDDRSQSHLLIKNG